MQSNQERLGIIVNAVSDCLNIIADGRDVSLTLRKVAQGSPSDVPAEFRGPSIVSLGNITTPHASERLAFLFHVPDSLIYVGLMLGLDAEGIQARLASGFGADDSDAFGEAMNQSFGRLAAAATSALGEQVESRYLSTRPIDLSTGSLSIPEIGLEGTLDIVRLDFQIEGYDTSPVLLATSAGIFDAPQQLNPSPTQGGNTKLPGQVAGPTVVTTGTPREQDRARSLRIPLPVTVLLAEKQMTMKEVFELSPGSIIEFSKSSEDYLQLLVGGKHFAEGEAAKMGDKFCFQVKKISS